MKLNKEQTTALANKVIETIKEKTPKQKITKEQERNFKKEHAIIEEKNTVVTKLSNELSTLKQDFVAKYKGAGLTYCGFNANLNNSLEAYKKSFENVYTKKIPSFTDVYSEIVLNTAFSSAENLEEFIKELVEKYS